MIVSLGLHPISGSAVGATLATIVAVGTTLLLPGLGLVITGPLAAGIAGAGAGGVTAGLVGALIRWGIPEDRAKKLEQEIADDGILIGVKPRTDGDARVFESDRNLNRDNSLRLNWNITNIKSPRKRIFDLYIAGINLSFSLSYEMKSITQDP